MVTEGEKRPWPGMVSVEDRQAQVEQVQKVRPALDLQGKGQALLIRSSISNASHLLPAELKYSGGRALCKLNVVTAQSQAGPQTRYSNNCSADRYQHCMINTQPILTGTLLLPGSVCFAAAAATIDNQNVVAAKLPA